MHDSWYERSPDDMRIQTLARGIGITLPGRLLGRGLAVLTQIILARLLGPEVFGLYAIAWTMLRLGEGGVTLGLDQGVIHFGSREVATGDHNRLKGIFHPSFAMALAFGTAVGAILYLLAPRIAVQFYNEPELAVVIRWLSPAFAFAAGLHVAAAATRVSQRMQFSVVSQEIFQPLTNITLVVVAFLLGWGVLGAVGAGVVSYGLAALLAIFFVRRLFPRIFTLPIRTSMPVRVLLRYSLPAPLAALFTMGMVNADRLLVGLFLPIEDVGIYQAASLVSVIFALILAALSMAFSPMVAELHHKGDLAMLGRLYKAITRWGMIMSLPVLAFVVAAPREIMVIVYGDSFEGGWLPLVILAIGNFLRIAVGPVDRLLVMSGNQNRWFWSTGLALGFDIGLILALTPRYGLAGAACASTITTLLLSLAGLLQVRGRLRIWPYERSYWKMLLAGGITALILFMVRGLLRFDPVPNLSLTIVLSLAVFGGGMVALGLEAEDREIFHWALDRMRRAGLEEPR
jgi:O-antigen/teichoic acid export membrane protein